MNAHPTAMMRAIVQDRYGEAEVLRLEEVPVPTVRPGRVLVEVRAAGVDPGVWHLMAGVPGVIRLAAGLRKPRWPVRGAAFAGIVREVGDGVIGVEIGDEVYGTADGSFAEYALARADKIAAKPPSLTFEQAAAVPISGPTALQSLRDALRLEAGQHLLVLGAAGGVGHYAVQLGAAMGARVTGAASAPKLDLVRALGAAAAIDYRSADPLEAGPYDAILDTGGLRPLAAMRRALTPTGALAIVGGEDGGMGGLGRMLAAPIASALGRRRLAGVMSIESVADLDAMTEWIESGRVRPVVDRVFPLAEAANALRHIDHGHGTAKTVLRIHASSASPECRAY